MIVLANFFLKSIIRNTQLLLGFLLLWLGCSQPKIENTFTGQTMGTTYSIKIISNNTIPESLKIQKGIDSVLKIVNLQMSTWIPSSEISRFNQNQTTKTIMVSHDLANIIKKSIIISEATNGAFDVTVYDLLRLWGFGPNPKKKGPLKKDIKRVLENIGYRNLVIEQGGIRKLNPKLKIDLNSIAKGDGVDRVFNWMASKGFKDIFIEIGGEVRCSGLNINRQHWKVGIDFPNIGQSSSKKLAGVVTLNNSVLATSGNYRNYIKRGGRIIGHTIDPRIGNPVETNVLSVSVIAKTCMEADAWATALMVMSYNQGREVILKQTGLNACWILSKPDGNIIIEKTPGFNIQNS